MALWRVSWIEVETTWTDDQWFAFLERASERIKRETKGVGGGSGRKAGGSGVSHDTATKGIVAAINKSKKRKAEKAVVDGN